MNIMKKVGLILTALFLMAVSLSAQAATPSDYFVGDWKVVVIGTPSGDAEMIMHLERIDGKLKGEMRSEEEGADPIKIDRIEEKENSISVFYFAGGYDISMTFNKVDDNNIKGDLLGMFTSTGERIVK